MLPFVFCNPLLSCAENLDVLTDDHHLGCDGDENFDVLTDDLQFGGDGDELLKAHIHLTHKVS